MGGAIPKPFIVLGKKKVIDYSLEVFSQLPCVTEICVVCGESFRANLPSYLTFAEPGARRQDSVYNGLLALKSWPALVAVHDAARPLITQEVVLRVIKKAAEMQGAIAAVPVKSTIKKADEQGLVANTPRRSELWEAQTPQVFCPKVLLEAFQHPVNQSYDAVDDASLVERAGCPVALVMGCYGNIKLTTQEDLAIASHLLCSTIS